MTIVTTAIDLLYNLASSLGTREKVNLNFEFTRKMTINLK